MSFEKEVNSDNKGRIHQWLMNLRSKMEHHPALLMLYKLIVIGLGFLCLIAGLIMLVTPGPGWLFIFLGMGLWATEFTWAHRFNQWAKTKVLGIWQRGQEKVAARRLAKNRERWAQRPNKVHYCEHGCHYHR